MLHQKLEIIKNWRRISQNEIRNSAAAESVGQKSESLILVRAHGIEPCTSFLSARRTNVGEEGIEPSTSFLSGKRSTTEPLTHITLAGAVRKAPRQTWLGRLTSRSTNELSAQLFLFF